jgi:hypothetical protein
MVDWIRQLRAEGYSVGQDREGFYHWITPGHTSPRKRPTEGDAWAAARAYRNDTRPDKSVPVI